MEEENNQKNEKAIKGRQAEFSLRFSDNREINLDEHIHLIAKFLFCKIFESDATQGNNYSIKFNNINRII